jgi:hypothetical protein
LVSPNKVIGLTFREPEGAPFQFGPEFLNQWQFEEQEGFWKLEHHREQLAAALTMQEDGRMLIVRFEVSIGSFGPDLQEFPRPKRRKR